MKTTDEVLHDAAPEVESLERRIMEVALEKTGARHGAILLWDDKSQGLAIHFHVVDDLIITLPDDVMAVHARGNRKYNGVAAYCYAENTSYLCQDATTDPHYAPYFFDVASIAAVPIPYQGRAIGVISVSSPQPHAFQSSTLDVLEEVAQSSAKFLRRAQLYRLSRAGSGRPFLIKGLCPEWLEVERRIERVANTKAPVLVQGESGTGKELVAHAIHFNSQRADKAFITVNCAAIPETLFESVLFGHLKGAFTGATHDKKGEFQKADGGTLFLDELGELPVPLQAKVLRAVEDGEIQPLGSSEAPQTVDVRLICATNRDLPAMAREGTFREDLYYRLSVMTMELPPLRAYKDDNLEVLAQVFLKRAAETHERSALRISSDAMSLLMAYDFPGNVRELKNAMEHAVIMATGDTIDSRDLPAMIRDSRGPQTMRPAAPSPTLAEMRERWLAPLEARWLGQLLDDCGGSVRRAAKRAGVNPVTLYRLLDKRGMSRSRRR